MSLTESEVIFFVLGLAFYIGGAIFCGVGFSQWLSAFQCWEKIKSMKTRGGHNED